MSLSNRLESLEQADRPNLIPQSTTMSKNSNDHSKCDIVIKNLMENGAKDTLELVKTLLSEGLGCDTVNVVSVERKDSYDNRPGIIFATLESHEQKSHVFKSKGCTT